MIDWEARYRANPDPFDVAGSWYEQRKIQVCLASLTHERYRHVWDTACGTGDFTTKLASRAHRVTATDVSDSAVAMTRAKLSGTGHGAVIETAVNALPQRPASVRRDTVDLVVCSEVLYYLPVEQQHEFAQWCAREAEEVLSVSWRYQPGDAWNSGVAANRVLGGVLTRNDWHPSVHHEDTDFVLDCWGRTLDA